MKDIYLIDFQEYLNALNFKFSIQYYSDDTLKLKVENEDGDIQIIYEGDDDDTDSYVIDYRIHIFLCEYIASVLLSYDDLNIAQCYSPWRGFVIDGKTFNIDDYKNDYDAFLKDILHFVNKH